MARTGKKLARRKSPNAALVGYEDLFADVARVIEEARRAAIRSVNAVMTATYWLVGRRIVEQEQDGRARAGYGEALLEQLSADLTARFGRGFSVDNLETMRRFFNTYPDAAAEKSETLSRKSFAARKSETPSRESELATVASRFPLSWSHYVLLVRTRSAHAREFYDREALRGGWTVRQHRRKALALENLALRHQVGVLKRTVGNRKLKLGTADRGLWATLSAMSEVRLRLPSMTSRR